jgi:signal transduction histidine kinase
MFREDRWPFIPTRLSEIIDQETLAVIEAGCCERLGRALTLLDYDPKSENFGYRIESVNQQQHWGGFCAYLRDERWVHGADEACKACDIREAKTSFEHFRIAERNPFRTFPCYVGLQDATYIVRVRRCPVAMLFTGQHRPPDGVETVKANVRALGSGRYSQIHLAEDVRTKLISLAEDLPSPPENFEAAFQREAEHIQRLAEAYYKKDKSQWEQSFLDTLRVPIADDGALDLDQVRWHTRDLLSQIREFCRCEYAIFFASAQEGKTVLMPIAGAGIPATIEQDLPHFNWKKAALPVEAFDITTWDIAEWHRKIGVSGIRGGNSEYFARASCIIPTVAGSRYRGILVFGPFSEHVDLQDERRFLIENADIVSSFALTQLEVHHLEQERRRWRSTAMLLTHQLRTALTPITTQVGRAKLLAQTMSRDSSCVRVVDLLRRAEDLSLHLAASAKETLAGHVLQLEQDDLEFERYPLSVLVANCADGFAQEAGKRHRQLVIDKSVELLPEAEVDVARLTIAISNLIENTLKYSYPNTTIYVRASQLATNDPDLASAVIEVNDLGDEIREEDRVRIFEQGTRALTEAKMDRIPGTGLGLWEARAVVEAHGGEIGVTCEPTQIQRSQGLAYLVVFSVRIPLRRRGAKRRSF